jgi:hypothetical protein
MILTDAVCTQAAPSGSVGHEPLRFHVIGLHDGSSNLVKSAGTSPGSAKPQVRALWIIKVS